MTEQQEVQQTQTDSGGNRTPVIIGLLVLIAVAASYYYFTNMARVFTREGKVTYVDVDKRIASLELPDPKGGMMDVEGQVAPECKITVNGKEATLNDIQIGDDAKVRVEYRSYKKDGAKIKEWIVHKAEITRKDAGA